MGFCIKLLEGVRAAQNEGAVYGDSPAVAVHQRGFRVLDLSFAGAAADLAHRLQHVQESGADAEMAG